MPQFSHLHRSGALVLGLGLLFAACDSATEPVARRAAEMTAYSAAGTQTAATGQPVASAPGVRVLDGRGRPFAGASVRFVVTQGAGSLTSSTVVTGADGVASAGEWRLGSAGENRVEARLGALTPVTFTANATSSPGVPVGTTPSAFAIDVRVIGEITPRQLQSVRDAVNRWQTVITTDAPDVRMNVPAASCFPRQPALNAMVDDLVLYVEFAEIDGAGSVLGEAGPCYVRTESSLPIVGVLKLDAADLARMEQTGTMDDVVLHEIGHVLGIGTLWSEKKLVEGEGGADPRFIGARSLQAYREMGGLQVGVAVENTGGVGTRDGHWRESEFGNELMTGFVGSYPNPLSALTIASLQDVGYGANALTASQYTLGGSFGRLTAAPVDLSARERVRKPKFRVDRKGRHEKIDS